MLKRIGLTLLLFALIAVICGCSTTVPQNDKRNRIDNTSTGNLSETAKKFDKKSLEKALSGSIWYCEKAKDSFTSMINVYDIAGNTKYTRIFPPSDSYPDGYISYFYTDYWEINEDKSLHLYNDSIEISVTHEFKELKDSDIDRGKYHIDYGDWYVSNRYLIIEGNLYRPISDKEQQKIESSVKSKQQ